MRVYKVVGFGRFGFDLKPLNDMYIEQNVEKS